MSGSDQKINSFLTDTSTKVSSGMIDEDKLLESSRTDSGFLSGEIVTEDNINSTSDSGCSNVNLKTSEIPQFHMRLDSGVGLTITESFSELSLEKNATLNDLNLTPKQHKSLTSTTTTYSEKPTEETKQFNEQPPWELYYAQDEDGDT